MSKSERTSRAREREKNALSMRRAGDTYAQVAEHLGYGHPSNARRAVFRALDRIPADNAQQLRSIEGVRLDALQAAHWRLALGGNVRNAQIVLRVMDRRARLFGLDAQSRVDTSEMDAEIRELAASLMSDDTSSVARVPEVKPDEVHSELSPIMEDEDR